MDVNKHIQNIVEARELLGEKLFSEAAALIYSTYYIKQMIKQEKRVNRTKLQKKVNKSLRELNCEEFPYCFFRKII